jgi:Flp pilus assembly protein TadD/ketosteroid isomerase-like protein
MNARRMLFPIKFNRLYTMPPRISLRQPASGSILSRFVAALAAILLGAASCAWGAPADELHEAQKLYGQGKLQPALDKVEDYLKSQPRDPQGRFLKGLVLTEQKHTTEAIQVFTGLTEDYPELPEPYNNLAVLYASQGNYDKAKSALELAIHTHPSYATAHENLGDIYAQLASRAYDRALQLDKNNTTAQVKLAMVKKIFTAQNPATLAATAAPPAPAKAEAPKAEKPAAPAASEPPKSPKPEAAKSAPAKAPKPEAAKSEPAKVASAPPEPAKPSPAEPKKPAAPAQAAAPDEAKAQVTEAIEGWAQAWSAKDVKGYVGHYVPTFASGAASHAAWEKQRAERITHPKSIEVTVKVLSMQVNGDEASATIRQSYKSDTLKSNTTKTLKLVKTNGRWLIKQERVGG